MKQIKILTVGLLVWYLWARWHVLDITNATSKEWLSNSLGNYVAILSGAYLLINSMKLFFNIKTISIGLKIINIKSVFALSIINSFFLFEMSIIFVIEHSFINFLYVLLDIAIVYYYILVLKICAMNIFNSTKDGVYICHTC
jgi:hypothetical protein